MAHTTRCLNGVVNRAFAASSRRVEPNTLERVDSPEQIDSWNRTWVFFEWTRRPYWDRSKPEPPARTRP